MTFSRITYSLPICCACGDSVKKSRRFMLLYKQHRITLKNKWHLSDGSPCRMINAIVFSNKELIHPYLSSWGLLGNGKVELSSALCHRSKRSYYDGIGYTFEPVHHWALTFNSMVWLQTNTTEQNYEQWDESPIEKLAQAAETNWKRFRFCLFWPVNNHCKSI